MKRYGNLFEKIADINNIVRAHLNARKGKTKYREVRRVDRDVLKHCAAIRQMLIDKTYTTSKYHDFEKVDGGKLRNISELPYYPDRIIQWAIIQVIEPIFCKHFIPQTYAAIPRKGTHAALAQLKKYMTDREGARYCLKLDVKKFFPSIDKQILKDLLRRKFKDERLLWLLDDIVDSFNKESAKGIPIGSYTSQYFGNFYLSYFDHWLKEKMRVKYYLRYMDDIIILSDSKEYLHRLRRDINKYLTDNLALTVKENWQVFPSFVRGVDFVGYRCFGDFVLLRNRTKANAKATTKKLRRKQNQGKPLTVSDRSKIGSYVGIFKWGDCTRLADKTINTILGGQNGISKRNTGTKAA